MENPPTKYGLTSAMKEQNKSLSTVLREPMARPGNPEQTDIRPLKALITSMEYKANRVYRAFKA